MAETKKTATPRDYAVATWEVLVTSFKASPLAVTIKFIGSIISSIVPVATAYFAALTTTALAEAYNGNAEAASMVYWYILITAGLGLLLIVWNSFDSYVREILIYTIDARVSDKMYDHFLSLDFWRYDDKKTADLYDRAQRFSQFFSYIFDRLASVVTQCIGIIIAIIALFALSPGIATIVLVAIIPGIYIQFKISRLQAKHWNENIDVRRARWNIEYDLLQPNSIAELRLYGVVRHLLNLRQDLRDKDEKGRILKERRFIGKRVMSDGLESVAEVGSLLWIANDIIMHAQPIGQFIYVQQMVSRALTSASGFVSILGSIDEDMANLFDYQKFMKLKPRVPRNEQPAFAPKTIRFDDVWFHYKKSKKDALSGISLTIHRGQHVAIIGENGSGKSTLIKLLAGLYEPSRGAIMLDQQSLTTIDIADWQRRLSVLQQSFLQYRFATVQDNVVMGDVSKPFDQTAYEHALSLAEAAQFVKKLPKGDSTYPSRWMGEDDGSGTELSGGQWQRLALARNFYRDSEIIILDEPTSAIDGRAEAQIFNRLFAAKDKTIITVSHRLSTVKKADKIYVLSNGQIVESGTHDQLVAQNGEYVKLFASQME